MSDGVALWSRTPPTPPPRLSVLRHPPFTSSRRGGVCRTRGEVKEKNLPEPAERNGTKGVDFGPLLKVGGKLSRKIFLTYSITYTSWMVVRPDRHESPPPIIVILLVTPLVILRVEWKNSSFHCRLRSFNSLRLTSHLSPFLGDLTFLCDSSDDSVDLNRGVVDVRSILLPPSRHPCSNKNSGPTIVHRSSSHTEYLEPLDPFRLFYFSVTGTAWSGSRY